MDYAFALAQQFVDMPAVVQRQVLVLTFTKQWDTAVAVR